MKRTSGNRPIFHIFLVNFHHKKGSQIEFVYPPFEFTENKSENVPSCWKYLPTFCLPDGAHNVSRDTVFFTLPDILDPKNSVFGVSCYRQIAVEDLKIVTEDITRSSVQKAVGVLLLLPIYGYIEVKLSLIADAFIIDTNTDILVQAFDQLNECLLNGGIQNPVEQIYVGLNVRDLFLKWRHKLLILFKLFLLQKRVIFFGSPVRPTCQMIIGLISLYPELMNKGFNEVFCVKTNRPISPMPSFSTFMEKNPDKTIGEFEIINADKKTNPDNNISKNEISLCESPDKEQLKPATIQTFEQFQRDTSMEAIYSSITPYCSIKPEKWSAPIPIFQNGNLLCPYLSLPYMDLLQDPSVQSYVIGASNILFKQKRQLADVFVDTDAGKIELNDVNIGDMDLRKLLELSTEDRRFIDYLLKHVQNPKEGAEGSENWIREQFYGYTVALLRTSMCNGGSKELEQFNGSFMTIFRRTDAFDRWISGRTNCEEFNNLSPGHPFAGNLSVTDMKLKISQSMHNSESGRKINQAMNQTTKAMGGVLATAKSTFTSFWNSISTTRDGQQILEKEFQEEISVERIQKIEDIPEPIESCSKLDQHEGKKISICTVLTDVKRDLEPPRHRKESTKEELEEIIQKTTDKIIEYAKEVDQDFENHKGKVFTV